MLFLCRHGETMFNRKQIKQGRYSSLLTLKGIDQAKSMAYRMLDYEDNFKNYTLITSPAVRTRHTMQIIQEVLGLSDKKVIEEDLLNEIDAGDFTCMPKSLIRQNFPEFIESKLKDPINTKCLNGESHQDFINRLKIFTPQIKNKDNIILVTHGMGPRYLCNFIFNEDIVFSENGMSQNYIYMIKNNKYQII